MQRNTLYKTRRKGMPGNAMRRRRREEGGELIESEQRISGMAYSSSGSLLLFFFLPACLFSSHALLLSSTVSPLPCLAPSFVAPCTPFGVSRWIGRWKDAGGWREEAFLCLCAHGPRSYSI